VNKKVARCKDCRFMKQMTCRYWKIPSRHEKPSHPIPVQNEQIQRLITNFEFLSSSYPPPKRRLKKKIKWWERTWKHKQWNWWRREVLWKLRWMSSSTASVSLAVLVSPATSSILRHINSLLRLFFLGFYVSVAVKICRVFLVLIYFLKKILGFSSVGYWYSSR